MLVLGVAVLVVLFGVLYAYKKEVGKLQKSSWFILLGVVVLLSAGGLYLQKNQNDKRINYQNLVVPTNVDWEGKLDQQKVNDLIEADKQLRQEVARDHKIAKSEKIDDIKIQNELLASNVIRQLNEEYLEIIKYAVDHKFRMSDASIERTKDYIRKSGPEFHKAGTLLADGFGESEMTRHVIDNINAINNLVVVLDMIQNKDDIDTIGDYTVDNFFKLFKESYRYFRSDGDSYVDIIGQAVSQDN